MSVINRDEWGNRLVGSFFPAVPVPRNQNGNIHVEAQEQYACWMATQPAAGVALWAHTGRGPFLTSAERETIFGAWRKNLRPDQWIVCGVGSRRTPMDGSSEDEFLADVRTMAEQARDLGTDLLLVFPPTFYRGAPDAAVRVVNYHRLVAKYGLPLILFHLYAEAGGMDYSPKVLRELLAMDQVIGIKIATLDSVMTYQDMSAMVQREFPNRVIISGEDRFVGYSLTRGARGALLGLGAACTALQVDLLQAWLMGDHTRFLDLMIRVDRLAECTFIQPMEGYIERMLYVLALQGIIPIEAVHDPFGPGITEVEKNRIRETLTALSLLP